METKKHHTFLNIPLVRIPLVSELTQRAISNYRSTYNLEENYKGCLCVDVSLSPLLRLLLIDVFSVPWPVNDQTSTPHVSGFSEETLSPGFIVDQAGAALYGLPPALAVQRLHTGFGHHHFGAGETDTRLVLCFFWPAEESTGMHEVYVNISFNMQNVVLKICFIFCVFVLDRKYRVHLLQGDSGRVPHGPRAVITHQCPVYFRHRQYADVQGIWHAGGTRRRKRSGSHPGQTNAEWGPRDGRLLWRILVPLWRGSETRKTWTWRYEQDFRRKDFTLSSSAAALYKLTLIFVKVWKDVD